MSGYLEIPHRPPLEGTAFQGIRLLKLTVSPVPPLVPTSAKLEIHLNQPTLGLNAASFRFGGGKSLTLQPVTVTVPPPPATVVTATFDAVGDFHPYFVELVTGGGSPLHPFFARAEYTFRIHCDRGDCEPDTEVPAKARVTPPAVDYLTRDYSGFMQLLSDRVRVTNPAWADLSAASFERVLVELLAHHADHLSYYQDRVANEAFIDDASQRYSLQQHATLLGHRLFEGAAATAWFCAVVGASGFLPDGLSVRMPGAPREAVVVFHLPERTSVRAHHSRLPLAAWPGANDAALAAGATRVLLWGHVEDLAPGQQIAFEQGAFSQVVSITAVRQREEAGWVAQVTDAPHTAPSRVTEVEFRPPLSRALRPFAGGFSLYGNVLRAVHGERRVAYFQPDVAAAIGRLEVVIPGDRGHTVKSTVDFGGAPREQLRALRVPEGPLVWTAGDAEPEPVLELEVDKKKWIRVSHLHNSQPFDPHFVLTSEEDGTAWLHFGDGVRGSEILWGGAKVRIVYRIGEPVAGNVAPRQVSEVIPPADPGDAAELAVVGLSLLFNVTAGEGGRERETLDAARLSIPASLRHGPLQRAVALDDYARAAREVEGVARATARVHGGIFNTVLVLVDPEGQGELDDALRARVEARLEHLRMAGREHFVFGPEYVPLELVLALCVEPGASASRVRKKVEAALRPGTGARPGFFHPDRLSFGQSVELGEILARVQEVPGVRSVKALSFRKLEEPETGEVPERIELGLTQVARLDADEDLPDNGVLEIQIVGIEPGLEEADFRVEDAP